MMVEYVHLRSLIAFQILFSISIDVIAPLSLFNSSQSSAYERVIEPEVQLNGVQLNATAYRLNSGQTLNFTFEFSTKGSAEASFVKNYTVLADLSYRGIFDAYRSSFTYVDDARRSISYNSFGGSEASEVSGHHISTGYGNEKETSQILSGGEHTIKHVILFKLEGDVDGHMDINFLSEVALTIVESDSVQFAWWLYLILGALLGAFGTLAGTTLLSRRKVYATQQRPATMGPKDNQSKTSVTVQ